MRDEEFVERRDERIDRAAQQTRFLSSQKSADYANSKRIDRKAKLGLVTCQETLETTLG